MFGDAYVVPLLATFEDIRAQLGAKSVDLPSTVDILCKITPQSFEPDEELMCEELV